MVLLHLWGSVSLDTDNDREEIKNRLKSFLFENNRSFLNNYDKAKKAAKQDGYVEEMKSELNSIINEVMEETPSYDFIKLSGSGLKQLYSANIKTEESTKEVESITGTGKKTGETEEVTSKKIVQDKDKVNRKLNRKKLNALLDDDDFVSELSGITFTKYGRDLQSIKSFGKTYPQLFGKDDWYDLDIQFDVIKGKDTYAITPQKPLGKHAIVTVPSDSNIKIETRAKDAKIRADGITNGKFSSSNSGGYTKGRKEEMPIKLDFPELKGIKEQTQAHMTFKEVDNDSAEVLEAETEEELAEIQSAFYEYQKEHENKLITVNVKEVGDGGKWTDWKKEELSEEEYEDLVYDAAGEFVDYELLDDKRMEFEWNGKLYRAISFSGTKQIKTRRQRSLQQDVLNFDEVFAPIIEKWIDESDIFESAERNLKDADEVWQHKIEMYIKSPPKKFKSDGAGLYEYLSENAIMIVQYYARLKQKFDFNPYVRGGGAKSINEDLKQHVAGFKIRYNKLRRMGLVGSE